MPKVTTKTPVAASKVAPKSTTKVSDAEKAKEARLAIIVAESAELAADVKAMVDADKEAKTSMRDTGLAFYAKAGEHKWSRSEVREAVILAVAEACDIDAEKLRSGDGKKKPMELFPTENSYVSRLTTLGSPREEKAKQYAALVEKVEKGEEITLKRLEAVAKGNEDPGKATRGRPAASAGGQGNADSKSGKKKLETEDDVKTAFSTVISGAIAGDFDLDKIGELFAEQMAEFAAAQAE